MHGHHTTLYIIWNTWMQKRAAEILFVKSKKYQSSLIHKNICPFKHTIYNELHTQPNVLKQIYM